MSKYHTNFKDCHTIILKDLASGSVASITQNSLHMSFKLFLMFFRHQARVIIVEHCLRYTLTTYLAHGRYKSNISVMFKIQFLPSVVHSTSFQQQFQQSNGLLCAVFINLKEVRETQVNCMKQPNKSRL